MKANATSIQKRDISTKGHIVTTFIYSLYSIFTKGVLYYGIDIILIILEALTLEGSWRLLVH